MITFYAAAAARRRMVPGNCRNINCPLVLVLGQMDGWMTGRGGRRRTVTSEPEKGVYLSFLRPPRVCLVVLLRGEDKRES